MIVCIDYDSARVFQVTRAFSFTKTPKRAIQRAFMANCTPDEKGFDGHVGNSSTLAVSLLFTLFLDPLAVLQHHQVSLDDIRWTLWEFWNLT